MSMPHVCRCQTCGSELQALSGTTAADISQFNREYGVKSLASAIMKIAPEQAKQIAERWAQLQGAERLALDDMLAFLRQPPEAKE